MTAPLTITTEETVHTFAIDSWRLSDVKDRIEAANRLLARKKGAEGGFELLSASDPYMVKEGPSELYPWGREYELIDIEVVGTMPKYSDWTLLAKVEHIGQANLVSAFPNAYEIEIPKVYRTAANVCDECGAERNRNSTYLVRHDGTGEWRQVGVDCLAIYSPTKDASNLVRFAEIFGNVIDDIDDMRRGGREFASMTTILAMTAAMIDKYGWLSNRLARQDNTKWSTSARVRSRLFEIDLLQKYDDPMLEVVPTGAHEAEAEAVLEWVAELDAGDSDYLHNLQAVFTLNGDDGSRFGLICSAVASRRREISQAIEREKVAANSAHVGKVGEWLDPLVVTVTYVNTIETQFGSSMLVKMVDGEGNVFKAFGTSDLLWKVKVGDEVAIRAKVKDHGSWKGVNETALSHVKVSKKA